jgi:hypothetical protein
MVLRLVDLLLCNLFHRLFILFSVKEVEEETDSQDCHQGADLDQPCHQRGGVVCIHIERCLDLKLDVH